MWRRIAVWGAVATILFGGIPLALTLDSIPAAALSDHGKILINGNAGFTPANGVTGGGGTATNPYIIDGWNVSAATGAAITLVNTTAYFVLRNFTVHSGGQTYAGIHLDHVMNGRIENALIYDCAPALAIDFSSNLTITRTNFTANYASAWVSSSVGLTFTRDRFRSGGSMEFSGSQWVNVTKNIATDPQFRVGTNSYGSGAHYNVSENIISGIHTNTFELNGINGIVASGNRLSGTGPGIVVQRGTNVSVSGNAIDGDGPGIAVVDSRHVVVERNTVSNAIGSPGIDIASSSDIAVVGNGLTNTGRGVTLEGNLNVTVTANRLVGGGFWIDANTIEGYRSVNASNNTVNGLPFAAFRGCSDRVFDRAAVAQIFLVDCKRIAIRNETFADMDMGVELIAVNDSILESNLFRNASSEGALRVFGGANLTIARSNFTANQRYGLLAWYTLNLTVLDNTMRGNWVGMMIWRTKDARVFHNNFVHSQIRPEEAVDSATNGTRWDAGYPDGGNYWSYSYTVDQCSGPRQDICGYPDGIGDTPVSVWPSGVDRYPLIRPRGIPSIPPVARIDTPSTRLTATQVMDFNAWQSYDPDGIVVAYTWDFGDGTTATGDYVQHAWLSEGRSNVTLTVRDNSYETGMAAVEVDVSVPVPVAVIRILSTGTAYVNQRLGFDGGQSDSSWGGIVSYDWNFGDGTNGSGGVVFHQFYTPGTYNIQLTVANRFGRTATSQQSLVVIAIPDIPLRSYENPAGFRVPIPSEWNLEEDVSYGGSQVAAVLIGPRHDGFTTNLVLHTGRDTGIREDQEYLGSIVDGILRGVQGGSPGAFLSEGPTYLSMSRHAAVRFGMTIPGSLPIVQKAAIVVSHEHDRFWILILTVHADHLFMYNATFDKVLGGFEITLPSPIGNLLIWAVLAAAAAIVAVVLVVFLIKRKKRNAKAFLGNVDIYTFGRPDTSGDRYCAACGAPVTQTGRFCGACGVPLSSISSASSIQPVDSPRDRV